MKTFQRQIILILLLTASLFGYGQSTTEPQGKIIVFRFVAESDIILYTVAG